MPYLLLLVPHSSRSLPYSRTWLSLNFLHLKQKKTEVVVSGPRAAYELHNVDLGNLTAYFRPTVTNLVRQRF